jgi:hypothetical protein
METILVVFTKKKLESTSEINRLKKYAYNKIEIERFYLK